MQLRKIAFAVLLGSTSALSCVSVAEAQTSVARQAEFDVPAGDLVAGLRTLSRQARIEVMFNAAELRGRRTAGVRGTLSAAEALRRLLAGTDAEMVRDASGAYLVKPVGNGAETADSYRGNEIVVTAQKRVEAIQDVPIAISAFKGEDLAAQKIEGGFDLMKAVPNLTFSKSNFTSYNLSIRGIGTKAVSATTDPAVAVAFNSTTIIQNRLFEQEYYDIERVEVLRGPQGTLYGRNATAGVVNVISNKPDLGAFSGSIKGEVGNYDSRRMVGMLNVPVVTDVLGIRLAGSMTQRDGYDYNSVTKNRVNGRDLWSTRLTVGFEPSDRFRANFVWEHFEENDNRSRTGKQLCHRDDGKTMIGNTPVITDPNVPNDYLARPAIFSTGCKAGSLYDDGAFGTPNGLALPFVFSMIYNSDARGYPWSHIPDPNNPGRTIGVNLLEIRDPYGGLMQSRDLREIASFRDPVYRAKANIFQLNADFDITEALTLTSQTAYVDDSVYSFQDYNRFNTLPFFRDTSQFLDGPFRDAAPGGLFCDPQLGCSNTMAGFDISRSDAKQFSQEIRLASTFDGPVNFSVGGNYTHFKGLNEYYVMNNVLTALAMSVPFNGSGRQDMCGWIGFNSQGGVSPVPMGDPAGNCVYIDPNPVESIAGDGHNYFRSVNPFRIRSLAAFGELYWNIDPELKLTAGLRYTKDRKRFTPVPTQLLLAPSIIGGGLVGRGYPADPDVNLSWGEFTGRLGLDWQPSVGFTDDTLLYAFYSRGYKGGGSNPPTPGFASWEEMLDAGVIDEAFYEQVQFFNAPNILALNGKEYGDTFEPEFVNAFEIGTKNMLMNGRLTLNAHAFYYDYKDYQVSQIRNRTSVNENFDASIWGFELQTSFQPVRAFRIDANLGYLKTRIARGEASVDIMNRNLGNPDYTVVKSWAQIPANCVVPTGVAESWTADPNNFGGVYNYFTMCGGVGGALNLFGRAPIDPATGEPYDIANYPELNGGSGFETDLSGNELPNAPRWTANIGAQYTVDFAADWSATLRGDFYWQDKSWHRVYNYAPYDRLRGWTNVNLSLWIDGPEGLRIEAYVKNVFNSTPITDAFLNSDDSGLTTNVFTLDPRIVGFSIAKSF